MVWNTSGAGGQVTISGGSASPVATKIIIGGHVDPPSSISNQRSVNHPIIGGVGGSTSMFGGSVTIVGGAPAKGSGGGGAVTIHGGVGSMGVSGSVSIHKKSEENFNSYSIWKTTSQNFFEARDYLIKFMTQSNEISELIKKNNGPVYLFTFNENANKHNKYWAFRSEEIVQMALDELAINVVHEF